MLSEESMWLRNSGVCGLANACVKMAENTESMTQMPAAGQQLTHRDSDAFSVIPDAASVTPVLSRKRI